MKINKKGEYFVAYRDENDLDSPNTGMNPKIKVGDSLGKMNIKTGRFIGNTVCLIELSIYRDNFNRDKLVKNKEEKYELLIDEVIKNIKSDIENGDETVLDELLRMIPKKNLIESLAEERWSEFR